MNDLLVSTSGSPPDPARVSFDQLDRLVRVTTIQGWVYLGTLFAVCAAALAFSLLYLVPSKVTGEGILLIDRDSLSQVRAQATGRLASLEVKLGDEVAPGDQIGEISQDEVKDSIQEAQAKLNDAEREDAELTKFEEKERETRTEAIGRLKRAVTQAQETSKDKLRIAARIDTSNDRLRAKQYLGDMELLEAREKLYVIQDDLNKGQSKLAELDLETSTTDYARKRAQLERRFKIRQLQTKLTLDHEKLKRTSRIISKVHGHVAEVLSGRGELVHEGSPVVLLHSPRVDRGIAEAGPPYDSILFVPAADGKKIRLGDDVEVSPTTVKREEHGYIKGSVVAISELPATRLAMEATLEHPQLVDSFLRRYAPGVLLRVDVKLKEKTTPAGPGSGVSQLTRGNRFEWSSSSGRALPLKTGTMCQAAIVVEKRKLISLVLPWTKKVVGTE
jgi:HlyD family secretion protein